MDVVEPTGKSDYAKSVFQNFEFTDRSFPKAVEKAANLGKPLIVVFSKPSGSQSDKLVVELMPELKEEFGARAVFVHIDVTAVTGRELVDRFYTDGKTPYTLVLAVERDYHGAIYPIEPVMHRFVGSTRRFLLQHLRKLLPRVEKKMWQNGFVPAQKKEAEPKCENNQKAGFWSSIASITGMGVQK